MNKRETKKYLFYILLLVTAIIWGSGFIVVKSSLDYLTTWYLLAFRFTIGSLSMWIVFHKKIKEIQKADLQKGAILGFLLFLAFSFQIKAVEFTTVGKNAFLTAAYVVIVPFFCWLFIKKKPHINNFIGAFLCLIGIGFLTLDSGLTINIGDILTLICACFYAYHIIMSEHYMSQKHDPIILTLLQLSFAGIYAYIFAIPFEPFPKSAFNSSTIMGVLYLGVCCTMLAFLFQMLGQKHTSPTTASLILSTESVFGCIFSVLFLDEKVSKKMLMGCILIFVAIIISEFNLIRWSRDST